MAEPDARWFPEPTSALTRERPDLWRRAIALASGLTGYQYVPKLPTADGAILACGFGRYYPEPKPETPEEIRQRQIDYLERRIHEIDSNIEVWEGEISERQGWIESQLRERAEHIAELERLRGLSALMIPVPEGAMEWLLHEVGHYVAATPEERLFTDYGYGYEAKGVGKDREWQAWAWEEIVLAPWGPSREFAPPKHRGGVAYSKSGPIPTRAVEHVTRKLAELPINVEDWRTLYGLWIAYEQGRSVPAWRRDV